MRLASLLAAVLLLGAVPALRAAPDDPAPPDNWPAGGPRKEGNKITCPSHNLSWTLPEGSPFQWTGATATENQKEGLLVAAIARLPRKTPAEGEPTENLCEVRLLTGPIHEGQTAASIVGASNVQSDIGKSVFDGKPDASKTKVTSEVDVGNVKGSRLTMAGAKDKLVRWFILQIVTLRTEQYEWHINMEGGKEVTQDFGSALAALFKGVQFLETKEGVRGPTGIDAVPSHTMERGTSGDKDVDITIPGVAAKKPKGMTSVSYQGGADPALRAVWEGRSADGTAYLYFDIRTYDAQELQRAKKEPEDLVKDRETEWKTHGGEDAVTIGKGKDPWTDTQFAGAKGVGYRFTGSQAGHPFVEQGWVVKSKNNLLYFRAQFGGVNAEKTMDALFKAVKKGIKLP